LTTNAHRPLSESEIRTLTDRGCTCAQWSGVRVADGFLPERVAGVHLAGRVRLGRNSGQLGGDGAAAKDCGIYNATLGDCVVEDDVRIANVGVHIANYTIGRGACIENVGLIEARPGATFGNGVVVQPVNEGGGREVVLFNEIDSQFAHLMCLHRYRPAMIDALKAIARDEAAKATADRGAIGAGARVVNVRKMIDVRLGEAATVDGAASLVNGTVLSTADAPSRIGDDVQAEDFIVAEGSDIGGGAHLAKCYVGQACRVGRQFSAENSLFFANCEAFHGEACSVFAGPYTVTHHKSTLLIAGYFSFYNAGSGTNQSNHLYKLGPVHEGKLERGCKTGSFSYMMWPCRVGPFSVVLGKHTRTFDTADFPFSYVEASPEGRCLMTVGFNLITVGTVRDGAKWPTRDRRRGAVRRDRLSFDVFSPLTIGRMIRGSRRLKEFQDKTPREVETVVIGGAEVKRVLLRTAQKTYRAAIGRYLLDKILGRIEAAAGRGAASLAEALRVDPAAVLSEEWCDIGGQMMPLGRVEDLAAALAASGGANLGTFRRALDAAFEAYAEDEWAWVCWAYEHVFGTDPRRLDREQLAALADELAVARTRFLNVVLLDAAKEFDEAIRVGFGQDGSPEEAAADFTAVRGEIDTNGFVREMKEEIAAVARRAAAFKERIAGL
jgi:hypothetical protein